MPRNEVPGFADTLKRLRTEAGLTQQELAAAAGTHADSIVKLEKGDRQPSLELAWRLATALGVGVEAFVPPKPKKR